VTGPLRIGTRGSPLALAQSRWVQAALQVNHPALQVEVVTIKTAGDRFVDQPLSRLGGKGLFVKEIEDALVAGHVDCAVHSMKDVPIDLASGLVIAATPAREDPRDVLLGRAATTLHDLPSAARLGTSSLRRMALVRAARPDVEVIPLRGNVDTRLRKLDAGQVDAIVVAAAGLRRLGIERADAAPLDPDTFIPAIGQGVLAIESRDDAVRTLCTPLDRTDTRVAVEAERAFLWRVGGSCRTPLAAHAVVAGGSVTLRALIASPDGTRVLRGERIGAVADAARLGEELAAELLARGGAAILAALHETSDAG